MCFLFVPVLSKSNSLSVLVDIPACRHDMVVVLFVCVQVAVKIVKRAGLPEDDEKALKDEVRVLQQ